jgi:hypothetical protein
MGRRSVPWLTETFRQYNVELGVHIKNNQSVGELVVGCQFTVNGVPSYPNYVIDASASGAVTYDDAISRRLGSDSTFNTMDVSVVPSDAFPDLFCDTLESSDIVTNAIQTSSVSSAVYDTFYGSSAFPALDFESKGTGVYGSATEVIFASSGVESGKISSEGLFGPRTHAAAIVATATQSVAHATPETVEFDFEEYDSEGTMVSLADNGIYIRRDGLYLIVLKFNLASTPANNMIAVLMVDGVQTEPMSGSGSTANSWTQSINWVTSRTSGELIQALFYQTSGGSINSGGASAYTNRLSVTYISD